MIVTSIEPVTRTKLKVYLDGQFAFVLYKGELFRYKIQPGNEITQDVVEEIYKTVLLKRAKLRAMHLLTDMDRTEEQLREKLKNDLYPEIIVEQALDYVKRFGYVDDNSYARRMVMNLKGSKSRLEIQAKMQAKGFDKDAIDDAMEECYEHDDAKEAIRTFLRKKRYSPNETDKKAEQKLLASLARKGFRYDDIKQVIQESEWNA